MANGFLYIFISENKNIKYIADRRYRLQGIENPLFYYYFNYGFALYIKFTTIIDLYRQKHRFSLFVQKNMFYLTSI